MLHQKAFYESKKTRLGMFIKQNRIERKNKEKSGYCLVQLLKPQYTKITALFFVCHYNRFT